MSVTRRNPRWLIVGVAGAVAASFCAPAARADFIVEQQPTANIGLFSTLFTLQPTLSILEIDSFTTTAAYRLGTLTAFSANDGPGPNISVSGSIYSGAPPGDPGADLVATASGTLDADHNIVVDFGGELLPAGSYYLTAFTVRQTVDNGIWFWNTTFTGPQALTYPIGQSIPPAQEISPFTGEPLALAYTLTGAKVATAVPEPPSWALFVSGFALAGLLTSRRRMRPFALSSKGNATGIRA